jgi:hypothetical protein
VLKGVIVWWKSAQGFWVMARLTRSPDEPLFQGRVASVIKCPSKGVAFVRPWRTF